LELSENTLSFGGYVPNEAARETLMNSAKAAFPKHAIVDKMSTAGGAPRGWIDTTRSLLDELANLASGKVTFDGKKIRVEGVAVEQATAEAVRETVGKIGVHYDTNHSIRFLNATIPLVSPFVTSFLKDDKQIILSGYAPNQAEIDRLVAAATKQAGTLSVVSNLAIARGAPEGWRLCTAAGLEGLARLDTGRAEIVARKLNVTGVTTNEETGLALPGVVRAAANRACEDVVEVKLDLPPEPDLQWKAVEDVKKQVDSLIKSANDADDTAEAAEAQNNVDETTALQSAFDDAAKDSYSLHPSSPPPFRWWGRRRRRRRRRR
jgi:hypothetical protein